LIQPAEAKQAKSKQEKTLEKQAQSDQKLASEFFSTVEIMYDKVIVILSSFQASAGHPGMDEHFPFRAEVATQIHKVASLTLTKADEFRSAHDQATIAKFFREHWAELKPKTWLELIAAGLGGLVAGGLTFGIGVAVVGSIGAMGTPVGWIVVGAGALLGFLAVCGLFAFSHREDRGDRALAKHHREIRAEIVAMANALDDNPKALDDLLKVMRKVSETLDVLPADSECSICLHQLVLPNRKLVVSNASPDCTRHPYHADCLKGYMRQARGIVLCPCCKRAFTKATPVVGFV